jgi:arylamine N-acetyltransferase
MDNALSPSLVPEVLARLGVAKGKPTLPLLDQLVNGYIRQVPWETAFRIARRAKTAETENCPRWPEQFWQENIEQGGGGTCFESNYAFYSLLRALGYDGYLTINNMGVVVGCHTAIIIILEGAKWLVDAGHPLLAPLPISSHGTMHRSSKFLHYTVHPDGENRYQIEHRPHPNQTAYTLIDKPVPDADYRAATTKDYGPGGLFLNHVIINKVVNERPWRFNMRERPWRLNMFWQGVRTDVALDGDPVPVVARHFGIDKETVRIAFAATERLKIRD